MSDHKEKDIVKDALERRFGKEGTALLGYDNDDESDIVHVTRIGKNGDVYGHATDHCGESGCAGEERYWGVIEGVEVDKVYEIKDYEVIAQIEE